MGEEEERGRGWMSVSEDGKAEGHEAECLRGRKRLVDVLTVDTDSDGPVQDRGLKHQDHQESGPGPSRISSMQFIHRKMSDRIQKQNQSRKRGKETQNQSLKQKGNNMTTLERRHTRNRDGRRKDGLTK